MRGEKSLLVFAVLFLAVFIFSTHFSSALIDECTIDDIDSPCHELNSCALYTGDVCPDGSSPLISLSTIFSCGDGYEELYSCVDTQSSSTGELERRTACCQTEVLIYPFCTSDSDCRLGQTCENYIGAGCIGTYYGSSVKTWYDGTPFVWSYDTYYDSTKTPVADPCSFAKTSYYKPIGLSWYKYVISFEDDQAFSVDSPDGGLDLSCTIVQDVNMGSNTDTSGELACSTLASSESVCDSYSGCIWSENYGECTADCTLGDIQCSSTGVPQVCGKLGTWVDSTECSDGYICSNGGCILDTSTVGNCQTCTSNSDCSSGYCDGSVCLSSSTSCSIGVGTGCEYTDGTTYTNPTSSCNKTCNSGTWSFETCPPGEIFTVKAYWAGSFGNIISAPISLGESAKRILQILTGTTTSSATFSGDGGSTTATFSSGIANGGTYTPTSIGTFTFTATADGVSDSADLVVEAKEAGECGNDILESSNNEECDNGDANTNTCTASYGSSCTYCSDGTDGNTACTNVTLTGSSDGDGVCDAEETCLMQDCTSEPSCQSDCGNSVVETGEGCDDGSSNGVVCSPAYESSCTYCSSSCSIITLSGGTCQDGEQNGDELGIDCGGTSCDSVCEETDTASICSDYITQETCEAYSQSVADATVPTLGDNQEAECYWSGSQCDSRVVTTTPDGFKIGVCNYEESNSEDTCDDGFLSYSWLSSWLWDANNKFLVEPEENTGEYVLGGDGYWHYDPNAAYSDCQDGSRTIPCPAQVQLTFFTFKNLIGAILLVIVIYLIINEARKPKSKPTPKKKPIKKKVAPKKTSSKKKVVKKK